MLVTRVVFLYTSAMVRRPRRPLQQIDHINENIQIICMQMLLDADGYFSA